MHDITQRTIATRARSSTRSETSTVSDTLEGFETTVIEYASSSSAHGIGYIFEDGRWGLERLFWVLLVGFAIIFRYYISSRRLCQTKLNHPDLNTDSKHVSTF